jgi:hypothetical protein
MQTKYLTLIVFLLAPLCAFTEPLKELNEDAAVMPSKVFEMKENEELPKASGFLKASEGNNFNEKPWLRESNYSSTSLTPSSTGGFFQNLSTGQSSFSFGLSSGNSGSYYTAQYNRSILYDLGKYGRLDLNIGTGKTGDFKSSDYLFFAPSIDYMVGGESFIFRVHVNAPPALLQTALKGRN